MRKEIWLCLALLGFSGGLRPVSTFAQDWHAMTFSADARGIDENPMRGLIPYSFAPQRKFPHSMEWFYMPLSDIVTGPDVYDWAPVERELAKIESRGDQAAFRFYLTFPGKPVAIPRYLLAGGLRTFSYDDFDNSLSRTPSVAPDQSDPRLIQCLVSFVHALGLRYDGDPRIAYLTAGLVGFWGEWHVANHPHPGEPSGWSMSQQDKDTILQTYRDSFHKTIVLVRYPTVTRNRELLGYFGFHDDSFVNDTLGSEDWHFVSQMQAAGTVNSWKIHPIGGEIYPQLQAHLWDAWPNSEGQDVATAIATIHATWMLDNDLFQHDPTPEQKANALRADRSLGYKFYCSAARVARAADGSVSIAVRIENRGLAPFYAAWPVELEAIARGKEVANRLADWPLAALLPGESSEFAASLQNLPKGPATVILRVVNPLPNGHPVAFANAEMGTVKNGWLTLGQIDEAADQRP